MGIVKSTSCVSMATSIKVVACVRTPEDDGSPRKKSGVGIMEKCLSIDQGKRLSLRDPLSLKNKVYSFKLDRVLDNTGPGDSFESVVPLLEGVIEGINASVFAYGALGTGKTRLMVGYDLSSLAAKKSASSKSISSPASSKTQPTSDDVAIMMSETFDTDAGIILRSMKMLLDKKDSLKKAGVCDVKIMVSYFEVYGDEMRDLLKMREKSSRLYIHSAFQRSSTMHTAKDTAPDVRIAPDGSTTLVGLIEVEIGSLEDVMHILWAGAKLRSTMAGESTESNTMFSVNLRVDYFDSNIVRVGKIIFVDLAGTDKSSSYNEVTSLRLNKNKNLTVLGKVLSALQDNHSVDRRNKRTSTVASAMEGDDEAAAANGASPPPPPPGSVATPESSPGKNPSPSKRSLQGVVVPYRESKLTRVLTECLGKNANSLFFCTLSPASSSFQESLRTMQFGENAGRATVEPTRSIASASATALHSQEGSAVTEAASAALANENTRLKILSRYLYNTLCFAQSRPGEGGSAATIDLKCLQATVEGQGGSEEAMQILRDSLMSVKNEKAAMEEEMGALRRELEEERREKKEMCQLIYSADAPQTMEVLDLTINSDDNEETIARKENQYFHTYGTHRDHKNSRRTSSHPSTSSRPPAASSSVPFASVPDDGEEMKSATESGLPAPTKEDVAALTVTRPALPKDKRVDFAMQSAILEVERQTIAKQRVSLLQEWKRAEDLRWSFVTSSVREHKEAVTSAQKLAVDSGAGAAAEDSFEGLKERTKMMELTLQVHEQTIQGLKASINKTSTRAQQRASTFQK